MKTRMVNELLINIYYIIAQFSLRVKTSLTRLWERRKDINRAKR